MTGSAKSPQGPNIWSGLTSKEVRQLLANDVAELRRVYALKAIDDANPPWKRNILLHAEVRAYESAQDAHFEWLVEIEAREARKTGQSTLG